eukprot:CAMPEP_0170209644 /NCGR_PEP_ID=MMETSP0116_2-20130129/4412_1 /TAXON_ID=400756 /ORGANISM="Durinskia baltica, Strain CSIRO CS-38" /LENGTH=34 /DNA_ID= /DNA_START= /DNA_END= /DNA_ORIENTATION=
MHFDYSGGVVGEIPAMNPDAGIQIGPITLPGWNY